MHGHKAPFQPYYIVHQHDMQATMRCRVRDRIRFSIRTWKLTRKICGNARAPQWLSGW